MFSWQRTEGVIIRSYVNMDPGMDSSDTYGARVGFQYTVSGREYEHYTISYKLEPEINVQGLADEIIPRYPMGKAVKVYYHQRKPQISVLETGLGAGFPYIVLMLQSVVAIVAGSGCRLHGRG